jgi:hypothetical protein
MRMLAIAEVCGTHSGCGSEDLIGVMRSQSHIATDGQSVSMSWCRAQIWDFRPEIFFLKVTVLSFWGGALSE